MADYLTTDAELTSIANAIRTKGGTQSSLSYPTGFVTAIQNISGGWELIGEDEITVSHTGGETDIVQIPVQNLGTISDTKILYARIRDKAGRREGYYYGCDCILCNMYLGGTLGFDVQYLLRGLYDGDVYRGSYMYGVYPWAIDTYDDIVYIRARYGSPYSGTIDGTFTFKLYAGNYPENTPIKTDGN